MNLWLDLRIHELLNRGVRISSKSNRIESVDLIRFVFRSERFETDKLEISNHQWFDFESLASCSLFLVSSVTNFVSAHINLHTCACAYSSHQLSLDSIRYFHLSDMTAQSMAVFRYTQRHKEWTARFVCQNDR